MEAKHKGENFKSLLTFKLVNVNLVGTTTGLPSLREGIYWSLPRPTESESTCPEDSPGDLYAH